MNRRTFVKWASAFPLLAQVGLEQAMGTGWAEVARNSTENIYTRLGVKPLINGRGTWTYLSASLELPEVRAAQVEAAQHFVNIFELQKAAGKRLAELTGAESCFSTHWMSTGRRSTRYAKPLPLIDPAPASTPTASRRFEDGRSARQDQDRPVIFSS